jgi:hypothetical protein
MLPRAARDTCQACICVFGGQATSSLLSSAAVDETEFRRSQPGCFGFSLQGNTTESQARTHPAVGTESILRSFHNVN